MNPRLCPVVPLCALALLSGAPALSTAPTPGSPPAASEDERIDRLESLRAAQDERLAGLEQQVAESGAPDSDPARAEALRQQIREVLSDEEFRESLSTSLLQAGYDEGFFIRSSDDKFCMNMQGFMQFRWTYYATRSANRDASPRLRRDDLTGFDIQRLRLIFTGNVYSPELTYYVHLYSDAPYGYDTGLLWGYLNYRFCDELQLSAGLLPLPSTRTYFLDERGYQFVDYPMVDSVFAMGDGVGAMLWGGLFNNKFNYYIAVSNELNGPAGPVITPDPDRTLDPNPALTLRAVWHAVGEDPTEGLREGDLECLAEPMLDFGFHYAFNEDDGDAATPVIVYPRRGVLPGGFGNTSTNGLQMNHFGLDAHFKWRGFSLKGAYAVQLLDVRRSDRAPFAPLYEATGDNSTNAQHGAYVQAGYFLPIPGLEKQVEVVARVGGISALSGGHEGTWEYAGGVNYYIHEHNVKLQMDVTKVSEAPVADSYTSLANINDDALVFRVQLQVGF
jgi:uncharacterized coiled-coil protein SlyX